MWNTREGKSFFKKKVKNKIHVANDDVSPKKKKVCNLLCEEQVKGERRKKIENKAHDKSEAEEGKS